MITMWVFFKSGIVQQSRNFQIIITMGFKPFLYWLYRTITLLFNILLP